MHCQKIIAGISDGISKRIKKNSHFVASSEEMFKRVANKGNLYEFRKNFQRNY